jgi:hypothetical protein
VRKVAFVAVLLIALPASATIAQQRAASKWTCLGTVTSGILQCQQSFSTTGANDLTAVWTTWQSSGALTATVSDTFGNYLSAVGPTQQPTQASGTPTNAQIFYLPTTGTVGGLPDTVTVTLTGPSGTSVPSFGMVMAEYSGLDTVHPLDSVSESISSSANGTLDSGTTSPANANLLVFGAGNIDYGTAPNPGGGFTNVQSNSATSNSSITEQYIPSSANNVLQRATASYSSLPPPTGDWLMQMAVFRAATWTGAQGTSSTRLHQVLYADQFPGSDIGVKINNAAASGSCAFPQGCVIHVSAGTYTYLTPINIAGPLGPVTLMCDPGGTIANGYGTLLNYTPASGIAVTWANGNSGGGMSGCAIKGSSPGNSTTGLYVSNIQNGIFSDLDISGFGTGLQINTAVNSV